MGAGPPRAKIASRWWDAWLSELRQVYIIFILDVILMKLSLIHEGMSLNMIALERFGDSDLALMCDSRKMLRKMRRWRRGRQREENVKLVRR